VIENRSVRIVGAIRQGRYLCEVRAGQYWRLENLKSFDVISLPLTKSSRAGIKIVERWSQLDYEFYINYTSISRNHGDY